MKKGFTLIELLAVILILGIIALIAVPQVTNVIENASRGAAETSAEHYLSAVNTKIGLNLLDSDSSNDIKDGLMDISSVEVDMTGEKPAYGVVKITNGKIESVSANVNGYNVLCDEKGRCKAAKPEYKYYSQVGFANENNLTDTKPNKNVYLKYPVVDDKIGFPVSCVNSSNSEYCLTSLDFETTKKDIIEIFNYNSSTWTTPSPENSAFVLSPTGEIACAVNSKIAICYYPNKVGFMVTTEALYPGVGAIDAVEDYMCFVSFDGVAACTDNFSSYLE